MDAYVNKTYNRHFKWDTFRVIIRTCQEFSLLLPYHIFSRFKIYPRHNTKLLPIPKRKRRLDTKTNYWISYLNNSWKRTELKMDIIWETHQYGNKSQRLLLFIFMHVSRVTSSAPESAMKETCVLYLGARNFVLSC